MKVPSLITAARIGLPAALICLATLPRSLLAEMVMVVATPWMCMLRSPPATVELAEANCPERALAALATAVTVMA